MTRLYDAVAGLFAGSRNRPPGTRLRVEGLETREVPAAFTTFGSGNVLRVTVDNDSRTAQNVAVSADGNGHLLVNNVVVRSNGRPVAASSVRGIEVTGSVLRNNISLFGVNDRAFRGLDGRIRVNAGGGDDVITGSWFADRIDGGDHNDYVAGGRGNDTLIGGRGADRLDGQDGNDHLYAGIDLDRDHLYGGTGFDTAYQVGTNDFVHGVESIFR